MRIALLLALLSVAIGGWGCAPECPEAFFGQPCGPPGRPLRYVVTGFPVDQLNRDTGNGVLYIGQRIDLRLEAIEDGDLANVSRVEWRAGRAGDPEFARLVVLSFFNATLTGLAPGRTAVDAVVTARTTGEHVAALWARSPDGGLSRVGFIDVVAR